MYLLNSERQSLETRTLSSRLMVSLTKHKFRRMNFFSTFTELRHRLQIPTWERQRQRNRQRFSYRERTRRQTPGSIRLRDRIAFRPGMEAFYRARHLRARTSHLGRMQIACFITRYPPAVLQVERVGSYFHSANSLDIVSHAGSLSLNAIILYTCNDNAICKSNDEGFLCPSSLRNESTVEIVCEPRVSVDFRGWIDRAGNRAATIVIIEFAHLPTDERLIRYERASESRLIFFPPSFRFDFRDSVKAYRVGLCR